jgi:3-oxoacyl-[acyl-carrier-protein] synthase-1
VINDPLVIVGLGATTAVGRGFLSSAAAVRAKISGFSEHPFATDSEAAPLRVAAAPWIDMSVQCADRLPQLLFPAIDEALLPMSNVARPPRLALALAAPSRRPGLPDDAEGRLRLDLAGHYQNRFGDIAVFPAGHAAGALALDAAQKRLARDDRAAVVVAGVDSYLDEETFEWLEENDQLHGAGPLNNAWGFIPGEAAGALLLIRESVALATGMLPVARLLGLGLGQEENRIKTDGVCTGQGLTGAFRAALGFLPSHARVSDVYCDLNGEPYRADEYGFACLRTKESFESASEFVAPADSWGDVSAASIPLLVMLAAVGAAKSYARGGYAFVWASSESGERGALLLDTARGA